MTYIVAYVEGGWRPPRGLRGSTPRCPQQREGWSWWTTRKEEARGGPSTGLLGLPSVVVRSVVFAAAGRTAPSAFTSPRRLALETA